MGPAKLDAPRHAPVRPCRRSGADGERLIGDLRLVTDLQLTFRPGPTKRANDLSLRESAHTPKADRSSSIQTASVRTWLTQFVDLLMQQFYLELRLHMNTRVEMIA